MPAPKQGKLRWYDKFLWRSLGPNQANYQVSQGQLIRRHAQRQRQRRQARQEEPIQHPLTLEPGLDPNAPLELSQPFRPTRPTQIHRIRLIRRLPPPPPKDRRGLPVPLRLPLFHALLSFIFLSLLPQHPLSIPTALGLAFVIIVYLQFWAYKGLKVSRFKPLNLLTC